jgi:hypothetical protein
VVFVCGEKRMIDLVIAVHFREEKIDNKGLFSSRKNIDT